MPKPANYGVPRRRHRQSATQESRDEQGWQRRQPLTVCAATHSRDGHPYERDQYGTVRKGPRP
jgi:hypothetical protein